MFLLEGTAYAPETRETINILGKANYISTIFENERPHPVGADLSDIVWTGGLAWLEPGTRRQLVIHRLGLARCDMIRSASFSALYKGDSIVYA